MPAKVEKLNEGGFDNTNLQARITVIFNSNCTNFRHHCMNLKQQLHEFLLLDYTNHKHTHYTNL